MAPYLRPLRCSIPSVATRGMRTAYTEKLPKTARNSSIILNNGRSAGFAKAREIGLLAMLRSPSLRMFEETVSGFELEDAIGLQLIRYEAGDYVGPHNDHHPQEAHLHDGYVDVQITLTSSSVDRQYLVYEGRGWMNQVVNVGVRSGVSVSYLPFLASRNALVARPRHLTTAYRWLLLVSYCIGGRG